MLASRRFGGMLASGSGAVAEPEPPAVTTVNFSRVRSSDTGHYNGTSANVNHLATPTAGNLLVFIATHRSDHANLPTLNNGTWTHRFTRTVDITRTHDRRLLAIWTQVATGGMAQFTLCTWPQQTQFQCAVHEFAADSAFDWSFLGSGGGDTGIGATTSEPNASNYGDTTTPPCASAGFSASPAGNKSLFRLSIMGGRIAESGAYGSSWANAGSNIEHPSNGGYQEVISCGFLGDDVGGGSLSDSLTWTSDFLQPTVAHLAFGAV